MTDSPRDALTLSEKAKSIVERWREVEYAGVKVSYKQRLDGGGSTFGQDYIKWLTALGMPRQRRVFEWCSGPAFIGFSMLAHGLCDTLFLADINPWAVEACRRTLQRNGLAGRVTVIHSDNLDQVPPNERFDLVVGNPPHFIDRLEGNLRAFDKDWALHKRFYRDIGRFLTPATGVCLIQENAEGSKTSDFKQMISDGGLDLIHDGFGQTPVGCNPRFYYVGSVPRGATPPAWLPRQPA